MVRFWELFGGLQIIFQKRWRSTFDPKRAIRLYYSPKEDREHEGDRKRLLTDVALLF
jgi:hypothetical protein